MRWPWGDWESGEASMDYLTVNSFDQVGDSDLWEKYKKSQRLMSRYGGLLAAAVGGRLQGLCDHRRGIQDFMVRVGTE